MEEKKENLKLILTKDNSYTIYNSALNETYHSVHGALQESKYVFIEKGLNYLEGKNPVNILEVGFGTGLNALLTLIESENNNQTIYYTGIELHPLKMELIKELNYAKLLNLNKGLEEKFLSMHQTKDNEELLIGNNFYFRLKEEEFIKSKFAEKFDLIYFDAFAPNKQAEMWNQHTFQHCFNILDTKGTLVTYCAKGDVKRTLTSVGFKVETLPGPPGKREMIRAIKN